MVVLEILLRGMAAGALVATGLGLLRGRAPSPARWTGALFCASVAAFALHSGGAETEALGPLRALAWLLSAAGSGTFWLFTITLFDDAPLRWPRLVPVLALIAVGAVANSLDGPAADAAWVVYHLTALGLLAHVLAVLWRHRADDLVEARRRVRPAFLAVAVVYAAAVAGLQIANQLGWHAPAESLAQAVTLSLLAFVGAWVLLSAPEPLYAAPAGPSIPARAIEPGTAMGDDRAGLEDARPDGDADAPRFVDVRDRLQIEALQALLDRDESLWRTEGLTVGRLAAAMNLPEHRLRRLINKGLGYRNFADFLNARRIAAAQRALADPARADVAISTIAFGLGYASLGPFNRAFKAITGATPTVWRARALAEAASSRG